MRNDLYIYFLLLSERMKKQIIDDRNFRTEPLNGNVHR